MATTTVAAIAAVTPTPCAPTTSHASSSQPQRRHLSLASSLLPRHHHLLQRTQAGTGQQAARKDPKARRPGACRAQTNGASNSPPAVTATVKNAKSEEERDVLGALSQIIDPDFGTDIVSCGFIKDLVIKRGGKVSFKLELTTPACPVKDEFERQARANVSAIPWVKEVNLTMTAQPPKPLVASEMPQGLCQVSNIIAVSSCKGGVGKSTVAVNLAYALAGMGARVGIFDADVYGPSLPTMVSPELRVLQMDAVTKMIYPTEYEGVKLISFGYAGQGSAIMRGPMVSGVVNQLLTTTDWGELDYLVIDMPPGTGDIQLTLCQVVPLTAAVIVTTPQKLAFIDVVKGVRMFAKLKVPCVAVVENMCFFDAGGKRYYPFGEGSGPRVVEQFGIPHLFQLPIRPELSASGDGGKPEVVARPASDVARAFSDIGVSVVQECAKLRQQTATAVTYNPSLRAIRVVIPGTNEEFYLDPAVVRRNDKSAQSVDEWTGEQRLKPSDVADDIEPDSIRPMGNYAVSISWPDGLNQVAPFEQLESLERMADPFANQSQRSNGTVGALVPPPIGGDEGEPEQSSKATTADKGTPKYAAASILNQAKSILEHARSLRGGK